MDFRLLSCIFENISTFKRWRFRRQRSSSWFKYLTLSQMMKGYKSLENLAALCWKVNHQNQVWTRKEEFFTKQESWSLSHLKDNSGRGRGGGERGVRGVLLNVYLHCFLLQIYYHHSAFLTKLTISPQKLSNLQSTTFQHVGVYTYKRISKCWCCDIKYNFAFLLFVKKSRIKYKWLWTIRQHTFSILKTKLVEKLVENCMQYEHQH